LQTIRQQWLTADYREERRLLEIVFLNCTLGSVTLCPEMRKPFDVLAEGLIPERSRSEGIRTGIPAISASISRPSRWQ
jgi:site-specific DNA recombinase